MGDLAIMAWVARVEDECVAVLATSRGKARRIGADIMGDDFVRVSVARMPQWDCYALTGHVPTAEFIAAGWMIPCAACGSMDLGERYEVSQMERVTCTECVEARS